MSYDSDAEFLQALDGLYSVDSDVARLVQMLKTKDGQLQLVADEVERLEAQLTATRLQAKDAHADANALQAELAKFVETSVGAFQRFTIYRKVES